MPPVPGIVVQIIVGASIFARGLVKHFDGGLVKAVDGVDLEVAPGARVAIMGPTGCGKSTLVSLLAILETPDRGELMFDGAPSRQIRSPERWRGVNLGLVFQLHHLLPHLTVQENIALPLAGQGVATRERRRRTAEAIGVLGLEHRTATVAAHLSGGERQLVALARALVNRPRLVLADEPTGSVDSDTGARIVDTLLNWCESSGATLLVVTHDPALAGRLDRVVRMRDGRIVLATPSPVTQSPMVDSTSQRT